MFHGTYNDFDGLEERVLSRTTLSCFCLDLRIPRHGHW